MSQLPDRRDLGFAGAAVFAVWFLSGVVLPLAATAGDWPQILGPDRRGQALDDRLPEKFPAATLKPAWELPVGKGFSGVAIQGDVGVVFDRQGRSERALGFHPKTGEKLWEQKFASNYQPQFIDDDGPRCTPTIAGDQVILFGAGGGLHVLDLATGAMQWTKETAKEFAVSDSYFGAGSTPLVVGDVVVVNVGAGREQAGLVGFDRQTSAVRWKFGKDAGSYSAPVLVPGSNPPRVLALTRLHLVLLDPARGTELARQPFGKTGPTATGASPVVWKDRVFLTASYNIGSALFTLSGDQLGEQYRDADLLASQYATPIRHEELLFAVDGRQDAGGAQLKCIDPVRRETPWSEPLDDYATLIQAGDRLLVVQTNGQLRLVAAEKTAYRELSRAKAHTGTCRALPAYAHGRLYIRNDKTLRCLDLAATP